MPLTGYVNEQAFLDGKPSIDNADVEMLHLDQIEVTLDTPDAQTTVNVFDLVFGVVLNAIKSHDDWKDAELREFPEAE